MLILGKSGDDKGTQLEELTLALLRHLGYRNCTTNLISAGGNEIDVKGEFLIPGPSDQSVRRLICECKAHARPIAMPDWLKFLGKIYTEQVITKQEVAGCFVSLCGVNGNVQGHYESLKEHVSSISLLHGDSLQDLACKLCNSLNPSHILKRLSSLSNKAPRRVDAAYYAGSIYWMAVFGEGDFGILDSQGAVVNDTIANTLEPMIRDAIETRKYINLEAEFQAQQRALTAEKVVLAQVFIGGGCIGKPISVEGYDFTENELDRATTSLLGERLLVADSSGKICLPTTSENEGDSIKPEVYLRLVGTFMPGMVLGCQLYDKYINAVLLKHICMTQAGLPLREEDYPALIELLRLSPTALIRTLNPIEMIVTHSVKSEVNDSIDAADRDYFFQVLCGSLVSDFLSPTLGRYFHDARKLRELDVRTEFRLKSATELVFHHKTAERFGIGPLDEKHGGGIIHVKLVKDFPEPWEVGGMASPKEPGTAPDTAAKVDDTETKETQDQ